MMMQSRYRLHNVFKQVVSNRFTIKRRSISGGRAIEVINNYRKYSSTSILYYDAVVPNVVGHNCNTTATIAVYSRNEIRVH